MTSDCASPIINKNYPVFVITYYIPVPYMFFRHSQENWKFFDFKNWPNRTEKLALTRQALTVLGAPAVKITQQV